MKKKKLIIKISRAIGVSIFCLLLLVNLSLYTLYYFNNKQFDNGGMIYLPYMVLSSILLFISVLILIYLYEITFNEYEYNGLRISVYSGIFDHYLYVNNLIADSYKRLSLSKTIYLRAKPNNHRVEAVIPALIGVRLLVDGKYIQRIN